MSRRSATRWYRDATGHEGFRWNREEFAASMRHGMLIG